MISKLIIVFITRRFRKPFSLSNRVVILALATLAVSAAPMQKILEYDYKVYAEESSKKKMMAYVLPSDASSVQRIFQVVLVCNTQEKRTKGLQGFRPLKKDETALFIFDEPAVVTFWMGDVAYAIDIIFVGPHGKVIRAFNNCKPGSRALYSSKGKIRWVLETVAGSGIKVGDTLLIKTIQTP